METIAGAVSSDHKATLVKEERDKEENWYVKWDESYIFPELEADEKISVESYPAIRGEIVDRNERGLAMNGNGFGNRNRTRENGQRKETVKRWLEFSTCQRMK